MNILYTHTNGKYWNKKQKLTENNYNYNYNQMLWYVHQKKKKKRNELYAFVYDIYVSLNYNQLIQSFYYYHY